MIDREVPRVILPRGRSLTIRLQTLKNHLLAIVSFFFREQNFSFDSNTNKNNLLVVCGARYKTRPGLTYHYTHSHKDKEDEEEDDMISSSPKRDEGAGHSRKSKYYSF